MFSYTFGSTLATQPSFPFTIMIIAIIIKKPNKQKQLILTQAEVCHELCGQCVDSLCLLRGAKFEPCAIKEDSCHHQRGTHGKVPAQPQDGRRNQSKLSTRHYGSEAVSSRIRAQVCVRACVRACFTVSRTHRYTCAEGHTRSKGVDGGEGAR